VVLVLPISLTQILTEISEKMIGVVPVGHRYSGGAETPGAPLHT
jgi:hypothetical protein